MNKKRSRIPKFKSDEEAAAFFDTHDATDFLHETRPSSLRFPKPTHKVVIEVADAQWQTLHETAHRRKISFSRLLEKFVTEKLAASYQ